MRGPALTCLVAALLTACAPAVNRPQDASINTDGYLVKSTWLPYPGAVPVEELTADMPGDTPVVFGECQQYAVKASEVRSVGPQRALENCLSLQSRASAAATGVVFTTALMAGVFLVYVWNVLLKLLSWP